MSFPTFCDACKARVEWHPTHNGKSMPIDPDPHAEGRFYFGAGLKLHVGRAGIRPRMYRCHWDTCAKGHDASKRALRGNYSERADQCDRWNCERDPDDGHRHCFKCGDVERLNPTRVRTLTRTADPAVAFAVARIWAAMQPSDSRIVVTNPSGKYAVKIERHEQEII